VPWGPAHTLQDRSLLLARTMNRVIAQAGPPALARQLRSRPWQRSLSRALCLSAHANSEGY
jgi:hypothetical protein